MIDGSDEPSSIGDWLEEKLLARGCDEGLGDLAAAATEGRRFASWLRALARDKGSRDAIAARSYTHDNGFDRISLCIGGRIAYELRLHIWRGGQSDTRERLHSHPWNFGSTVLAGTLHVEQYEENHTGDRHNIFLYPRPVDGQDYRLVAAGEAHLSPLLRMQLPTGAIYTARNTMIHRAWGDPQSTTVTLMLRGPGNAYPSRVFDTRSTEVVSSLLHKIPRFQPAVVAEKLLEVADIVSSPESGE